MIDLALARQSALTLAQFGQLADIPPELEWLANITNPETLRAYKNDISEFFEFAGLKGSEDFARTGSGPRE